MPREEEERGEKKIANFSERGGGGGSHREREKVGPTSRSGEETGVKSGKLKGRKTSYTSA